MQVLVALHQAGGAVVSRDELIARCWEGRVVGEDAINRAIGRLRRLSEADGGASFTVETIARVGYRLKAGAAQEKTDSILSSQAPAPLATARKPDRRLILADAAGLAALGAAGSGLFFLRQKQPVPVIPPEIAAMIDQGRRAQRQATAESQAQAIGILEHVVQVAPQVAAGWANLGRSYAIASRQGRTGTDALHLRAQAAIARALELDRRSPVAYVAKIQLLPTRSAWLEKDRILGEGLRLNPGNDELLLAGADFLAGVGRYREAADMALRGGANVTALDPFTGFLQIVTCWAAGRLAEADHAAAQAIALFPRNPAVWFPRISLLMYTGRADQALAELAITDNRPPGTPEEDFEIVIAVAQALKSGSRADADKAAAANLGLAHKGAGYAENAIGFTASLDHVDDAFAIADGLYFGRGFQVGAPLYSAIQGRFSQLPNRRTGVLLLPPARAMRKDARFAALVDELGLTKYWKDSGVKPDYQRFGDA